MKTEGIILQSLRYGDTQRVVHIYTVADGMLTFMVRAARGRGGVSAAMLQPLSLVEIDYDLRPRKNMQTLRDAHISVPYTSLLFDMDKRAIAMFLGEVLHAVLRGEQGSPQLFAFVSRSMQWLDLAERRYANFHLFFLLRLTRYLGFYPEHHPEAEAWNLPLLLRFNYRTMHLLRLNAATRQLFLDHLLRFYADHVPAFPEIRSAEILHQVLAV